jgi:glycosyltransferase involved in cell wall biosynthesis
MESRKTRREIGSAGRATDRNRPHFLLLEPYYGGSHRSFLEGLRKHVPFAFTLISLPARKWKMRMQLAAPWLATRIRELAASGARYDGILCSSFLDGAMLKTLLCRDNIHLPLLVYFHENQFAYPDLFSGPSRYQFTALNFTTALAADRLAFNSEYNRDTFFAGIAKYLKKATDMDLLHLLEELRTRTTVLYPGLDFQPFDWQDRQSRKSSDTAPVVVWNHRWEHDKDPSSFFSALCALAGRDVDFRLIVLGQSFSRQPPVFDQARTRLQGKILHFGYAGRRDDYARLLCRGDIVVSTARHEFFGMAVLEAVRCGCVPVVPDRLAYRELFPEKYRYKDETFMRILNKRLRDAQPLTSRVSRMLTEKYSWPRQAPAYAAWLTSVL